MSESVNPDDAGTVVTRLLPDPAERGVVLGQLVTSAQHADSVAPNAWGVTLYRNLFRLNVGRVEVLVVGEGFVRLNCAGALGTIPLTGPHFEQADYRSVPGPQCAFVGPAGAFAAVAADLQGPHRAFIEAAGLTRAGEPVSGSPHTRSHSPELMAYARGVVEPGAVQFVSPDEVPDGGPLVEGAVSRVTVNAYERNPEARRRCIAAHGTSCCICGFSFGAGYGPEADGYIHVHHVRPLSEIGGEYVVDPVEDLRPVCPNCHAVLHLGSRCRSIDEVRQLRAQQRHAAPGTLG